jgi:predicted DCC family thiol-disulfide oxidoreductase YuxK
MPAGFAGISELHTAPGARPEHDWRMHADDDSPACLTVYFDASCPLCRREIGLYRRLNSQKPIRWVDVSRPAQCGDGLSCELAMQRFHVRDEQGRLHDGASAFSLLWRCFRGWRLLGWLTAVPPLSWLAEATYRLFLRLRRPLRRG